MQQRLESYSKFDNTVRGILYAFDRPVNGGEVWRSFTKLHDPNLARVSRSTVTNIMNRFFAYEEIEGPFERGYCHNTAITLTSRGLENYYLALISPGITTIGTHLDIERALHPPEIATARTQVLANKVITFADKLYRLEDGAK